MNELQELISQSENASIMQYGFIPHKGIRHVVCVLRMLGKELSKCPLRLFTQ